MSLQADTRPNSLLEIGGSGTYSHQVAYDYLAVGRQIDLNVWAGIRPINRLLLEPSVIFSQSRDLDTDREYFRGYIARTRVGYQFSREFSARLVGEFNNFTKRWGVDPLITYRLNPFSTFYAGATYDYDRFTDLDHGTQRATTRLSSRQYFLKIQYLFQT